MTGVDASPQTLALARRRTEGHDNVELHLADATALPVPDGAFDAALSVQVLEYVADLDAALAELHRALRPGGRLVIWDVDWSTVSWHSADPARMARVLAAWDGHLADPCLPRTLAARLRAAGFTDVPAEGHTFATTELTPDAYGAAIVPLVERLRRRPRRHHRRRGRRLGGRAGRAGEAGRVLLRLRPVLLHRHPPRLSRWTASRPAAPVRIRYPGSARCVSFRWGIPARRTCARRPAFCCGWRAGRSARSRSGSSTGWSWMGALAVVPALVGWAIDQGVAEGDTADLVRGRP